VASRGAVLVISPMAKESGDLAWATDKLLSVLVAIVVAAEAGAVVAANLEDVQLFATAELTHIQPIRYKTMWWLVPSMRIPDPAAM